MFMFAHIEVTQDITTSVIPLEAVRIPLPKRPHTMINDFIYLLGYVFRFLILLCHLEKRTLFYS